jgi:hypothetical protein
MKATLARKIRCSRGPLVAVTAMLAVMTLVAAAVRILAVSAEALDAGKPLAAPSIQNVSNPEPVPDAVAYSMMFGILSEHDSHPKRVRGYLHSMNFGGMLQHSARPATNHDSTELDVVALIEAGKQFKKVLADSDARAAALFAPNGGSPSPEVRARLKEIRAERLEAVQRIADQLSIRLSSEGRMKVDTFINGRIKKRIKRINLH